ncbi:formate/nitrite transporter family protein [Fulvimarina sp. 2208YS6-2-32]|uniref:Formate/nitrite transporter family protein n=1 Tax=Fulvimarina uroteuthidis TaxID=3098149 RepID=A0ABU5I4N7_9HYPH|nr:formate/nitrite transporter family protein [Fulvimarina sp. 2208YS6-2-32]MDY8110345.1 formate/nitrite transporter family protein [Fulvimarina sp. 2208YS6-2-32]
MSEDKQNAREHQDEEMLRKDPDEELLNAPDKGETLADYFSFEEVFARVLSSADHELDVSNRYLFWSALGAGGAIGLTFLARVILTETAGETTPGFLGNLMYPVGFLIIVIGRYQLFTENTLTPVVLVLTKLTSISNLLRLWIVVLIGNMLGALAVAALIAYVDVLTVERVVTAIEIGRHAYETEWTTIFVRALIAGWIVAAMVWLVHASRETISKIFVVFILMYFLGICGFFHVITSSVEVFFLAFRVTEISFFALFPNFVLPVLLGNTVGGVIFVAVLNYAQFAEHKDSQVFERYGDPLSFNEWLFGRKKQDA